MPDNAGHGIGTSAELLEQIRGVLAGGSVKLGDVAAAKPAAINAGQSTFSVAETLGEFLQASAGVAGGIEESTADIQAAKNTYLENDAGAADLFRSHRH